MRAKRTVDLSEMMVNRLTNLPQQLLTSELLMKATNLPLTRGGWSVKEGLCHLVTVDERFANVINRHGVPAIYDSTVDKDVLDAVAYIPVPSDTSSFHSLLKTIVYQQLSGKSAEPIFKRLCATLGVNENGLVEPHHILSCKIDVIVVDGKRKVTVNDQISGLSESKSKYMTDLALHFSDESKLKGVVLADLSDDELYEKLVAVKGLGPWSVHMHMMFDLHRSNVLAVGDLGIRKGLSILHGHSSNHFENKTKQNEIPALCASWAPHSSLGCWYMWRLYEDSQQTRSSDAQQPKSKRVKTEKAEKTEKTAKTK